MEWPALGGNEFSIIDGAPLEAVVHLEWWHQGAHQDEGQGVYGGFISLF